MDKASPAGADRLLVEAFEKAQRLDPDGLTTLHQVFYPQIYRYAAYRLTDLHQAEDITAEVFVRMIEVLKGRKQTIQSIRAWLFGTAHHLIMDVLRAKYKQRFESIDDHENLSDSETSESLVERSFTNLEVKEALLQLNEAQQQVLALRFSQELSLEETAQIMGKNANAIKVLQFRALNSLRKVLNEKDLSV